MTERAGVQTVDLTAVPASAESRGPLWTLEARDLDVNLPRFDGGRGVPPHGNPDLDVVGVVPAGEGVLEAEGVAQALRAGQAFFIPTGAERSIRSAGGPFAHLSCHRRRNPLRPS